MCNFYAKVTISISPIFTNIFCQILHTFSHEKHFSGFVTGRIATNHIIFNRYNILKIVSHYLVFEKYFNFHELFLLFLMKFFKIIFRFYKNIWKTTSIPGRVSSWYFFENLRKFLWESLKAWIFKTQTFSGRSLETKGL